MGGALLDALEKARFEKSALEQNFNAKVDRAAAFKMPRMRFSDDLLPKTPYVTAKPAAPPNAPAAENNW